MKTKFKRIKKAAAILLIALFTISAAGCQSQSDDGNGKTEEKKVLNAALGAEPASMDPAISLTIDVRSYLSHVFEGLTVFDENGNLDYGVAKAWEANEDCSEYKFTLREDAVWTDGEPVTAEDFKYAWLRVLDPETASGWASYLYYIKGAEAYNSGMGTADEVGIEIGENGELIVTMESTCSFFAEMTAMQPYYPVRQDVIETYGDTWAANEEHFVSNGAYVLSEWKHDEMLVCEKNEAYWNTEKVNLQQICFYLMGDSNAAMNAYEADTIDFVESVLTSDEMEQIAEVQSCDFTYTKFLALNLQRDVFADVRVREAIAIALDRETIASFMGTGYKGLCTWVPEGFVNPDTGKDYRDADEKTYYTANADLETAKNLMEEAGYPEGEGFPTITYLTNTSSSNTQLAQIVKEQLSKIGINVNVEAYESKVFNEYRYNREFDIVAASWAAEYPDISSYFYGLQSKDINNYASFCSERFDELYMQALAVQDVGERYELYHEAENLAMESYGVIPLYAIDTQYIAKDGLTNYTHDVTGCLNFNYAKYEES